MGPGDDEEFPPHPVAAISASAATHRRRDGGITSILARPWDLPVGKPPNRPSVSRAYPGAGSRVLGFLCYIPRTLLHDRYPGRGRPAGRPVAAGRTRRRGPCRGIRATGAGALPERVDRPAGRPSPGADDRQPRRARPGACAHLGAASRRHVPHCLPESGGPDDPRGLQAGFRVRRLRHDRRGTEARLALGPGLDGDGRSGVVRGARRRRAALAPGRQPGSDRTAGRAGRTRA